MPTQKLKKKKKSLETNTLGSAELKKILQIGIERDALLVWGTPLNSYRGEEWRLEPSPKLVQPFQVHVSLSTHICNQLDLLLIPLRNHLKQQQQKMKQQNKGA